MSWSSSLSSEIAFLDDLDDETSIAGNSVRQDIIIQDLARGSVERSSFNGSSYNIEFKYSMV